MHRLFLSAPLLLAACSGATIGPSLATRPIEASDLSEPTRQLAAPAPADAELLSRIAALVEQAQGSERDFASLLPRAQAAAAAAGADGSESWIVAQQLLSALEGARAPATRSLTELDALIVARLTGGTEAGLIELQAANAEVATLVQGQQSAFDRLRTRINR